MQVLQNLGQIAVIVIGYVLGVYFQSRALSQVEKRIDDSNRRIADLRLELIGRLGDLRAETSARMTDLRDVLRAEMAKNQSELRAKFAELAARIDRQEEPKMVRP